MNRRGFVAAAAAASAVNAANPKLALLGGEPVRKASPPSWPRIHAEDEKAWMEVLRSGHWYRGSGKTVDEFEKKYAAAIGSPYCLATANGTSALYISLSAIDIGPGDEVLVPPYTFIATVNAVLMRHALPVFVDSDLETMQMDAGKVESRITGRTRAIMPVHLGGSPANLDVILETGKQRRLPVIEDACQAVFGEWRGRRLGSLGTTGCFSFQASKNLNSGEGGAVMTADANLAERAFSFHNNSRGRRNAPGDFSYRATGANLRMTEFQAALLMSQMLRLQEQAKLRDENAAYLTSMLREVPGIRPARMYDGCTRNGWHIYMLRYDREAFAGVSRAVFLRALAAEGVRASAGYRPLNKEPFLRQAFQSRGWRAIYPEKLLAEWDERNRCPVNDRLCEEAVWFGQTTLLGSRQNMEQIAGAIRKIQVQAADLRSL
ncbi:MAG: DegT/DnrJ/EryC1/StrS family aminotransferase [Bryobacteraceae bacterium]